MRRKTIKFRDHLVKLVLAGEKNTTWRLFDDKNLSKGDNVDLINWDTKEVFAGAELISVYEKKMGDLEGCDFDGHEKFPNKEEMYKTYQTYYGDKVNSGTLVKIIHFKLLQDV